MIRIDIRLGFALVALMATVGTPAAAEEQGSNWLGAVGSFVLNGLGPARTLEDIQREEQRARETPKPAAPKLAAPVPVAEPEVARPVTPPADPVLAAPVQVAPVPEVKPAPEPKKAEVKRVEAKPVASAMPVPEAKPMPVPEAKPKQAIARTPIPQPPPEPLTSRIAATATLDQAVKLGGSADIYSGRIKAPVRN
ncbi:MAG: hypothetical protein K2X44_05565 [Magnetospirillum sp.]|nr:hypothetical protein [Magnetospirillum sp.]